MADMSCGDIGFDDVTQQFPSHEVAFLLVVFVSNEGPTFLPYSPKKIEAFQ